ncbi:Transposase [Shigella dysenteriae 1617]|uniref:Transposase n=1 Tax=Shigella dysenteriae 1617 TaxID=754093 RepID=A0A0A6ZR41_SHIDY|nr:Transposase [Shigella dysenteriae 1617]
MAYTFGPRTDETCRLARKTICFSRSVEIHEKVIGTFIEKHMFY